MTEDRDPAAAQRGGTAMPRRTVLAVGALGAAGAALAACGGSTSTSSGSSASGSAAGGASASAAASASGGLLAAAGPASQVPVGGAAIVPVGQTAYVVAQPTAGSYVAHSAICPHQGCLCNAVQSGKAICPCHGSEFNVDTGAVEKGPAQEGLAPAEVKVAEGNLLLPS